MAKNPLDTQGKSAIKRLVSGDRRNPSPLGKAIGNVFLVLAILLIGAGAIIGFVQGVRKEPAGGVTATTTETTVTTTTTTTQTETTATQAL